jgi:hypothetical protein
MKQSAITLLMTLFLNAYVACDICGCSVHGTYLGGLQATTKNSFGLAHNYFRFNAIHHDANSLSSAQINIFTLNGNVAINEKWRVFALVPFVNVNFTEQGINNRYFNVGDASLFASRIVLNTPDSLLWRHLLVVNGGLKLPTGNYGNMNTAEVSFYNFRTGTASWDVVFSTFYSLSKKSKGVSAEVNYSLNTPNKYDYWFGNNFSSQLSVFSKNRIKQMAFIPLLAYRFEHAQKDLNNMVEKRFTGGYAHYATAGFMLRNEHLMLDVNLALPFSYNISEGSVTPFSKTQLRIIYFLKSKKS